MPKFWNETEAYTRERGFDMMVSFDSSNREQYVGIATTGTPINEAKWSIYKLEYSATTGGVSKKRYADGTDDFTKIWESREGYTYLNIT